MGPPWSQIIAYDLNRGVIKWRKPLGQDLDVAKAGGKDTGVPRGSQRQGMIVTSTGIVFSTARDGVFYAFDADNGEVLWSYKLPMATEGLPSIYEIDGTPLHRGERHHAAHLGSCVARERHWLARTAGEGWLCGLCAVGKTQALKSHAACADASSVCFTTSMPAVIISSTCGASSSGSRSALQKKREPPFGSASTQAAPL